MPANWLVYFTVDDIDQVLAKTPELGGKVQMGPTEIDLGRIAVMTDPHGAVFAVIQLKG